MKNIQNNMKAQRRFATTKNAIVLLLLAMITLLFNSCSGHDGDIIEPPPNEDPIPMDESPSWSPDGEWIAYTHFSIDPSDTTYPTGLYIIDTSGHNRKLVIAGFALSPDWSPDGTKIAFSSGEIYTITPNGDSLQQITNVGSAFFPSWSPDGLRLTLDMTSNGMMNGISIFFLNGNLERHLGLGRDADWSPDGKKIVYSGQSHNSKSENQIWIADTNGGNPIRLTTNQAITNRYPSWSPDGNKICWTSNNEIWVMDTNGNNQGKVMCGKYPSWSPDDNQIVFSKLTSSQDKIVLWKINMGSINAIQLTD